MLKTAVSLTIATSMLHLQEAQPAGPATPFPVQGAESRLPVGAALAWGDYDGDGRADVFVSLRDGQARLLRGTTDGLVDASPATGLYDLPAFVHGAHWVDFDRDGDLDLHVLAGVESEVYEQLEDRSFAPASTRLGLPRDLMTLGARWIDVDEDGWPDLEQLDASGPHIWRNVGGATFEPLRLELPPSRRASGAGVAEDDPGATHVLLETDPATPSADRNGAGAGPVRNGSGGPERGLGGGISGTSVGGLAGAGGSAFCAGLIEDQSGGSCLGASRVPTQDLLYPLGIDWFVDTDGDVGLGTLSPLSELHVRAFDTGALPGFVGGDDLVLEGLNAGLGIVSSAQGSLGSTLSLREVGGTQNNLWSMFRSPATVNGLDGSLNSELSIAFGSNSAPDQNEEALILRRGLAGQTFMSIGRGSVDEESHLHLVGGSLLTRMKIAPDSDASDGDDSELWLCEDREGDFGINLHYEGAGNQLQFVGRNGANPDVMAMAIHRGQGFVGIGTTDSDATLQVNPIPSTSTVFRAVDDDGDSAMRINSSGRVGIQTESPNASLGVKVIAGATSIIRGFDLNDNTVFRVTETGRVVTTALQITGGGDLVEGFEASDGPAEPGTVMVIDSDAPGMLCSSSVPYDARVAGIVSGAEGVHHGIRMGQDDVLDGDTLLAMTGRVWCKASSENGPIRPGDRLTTAGLAGHAMKATDGERSPGAVLGKAMTALDDDTGMVLALVNLQ